MSYLLDTDVVIYHLNGVAIARQLVANLVPQGVAMSIITYMEAVEGILRSDHPDLARRELDVLIGTVPVLPFSFPEADASARLRDELRGHGRRVRSRSLDLIIAATALQRGLTLVTNNVADYRDIAGLTLISADIT